VTVDTSHDFSPALSPAGDLVVWQHCASVTTSCDIWQAVKAGGTWTISVVNNDPANEELPDTNGNIFVYDSNRPSGAGDIFYRQGTGPEIEVLLPGVQDTPHISGDFISFVSTDASGVNSAIVLYQISTNRLWNLTNDPQDPHYLDGVSTLPSGEVIVVYESRDALPGSLNTTVHALRFTVPSVADNVPPTISIVTPVSGAVYPVNSVVSADYSCADSGSGIATCQGSVADGAAISTATAGSATFTVTASDVAGNVASQNVGYAVAYQVCLGYDSSKARKSGSTYPIKIQLCDANGQNVSSASIVVHAVSVSQVSTNAAGVLDDAGDSNPDFDFRYDAGTGSYIFNLKTTGFATGTYSLGFTAGADPILHSAPFQIK
jgi:hypothetical protein